MKRSATYLALVLLGVGGFATGASAQRYYDRPAISVELPGVRAYSRRDDRAARELSRLTRDVRQVRHEIREYGGGGRRIRAKFDRVVRATDQLNYGFRRGVYRPREVWYRAEQIRSELREIQRELRYRERGDRRVWRERWR